MIIIANTLFSAFKYSFAEFQNIRFQDHQIKKLQNYQILRLKIVRQRISVTCFNSSFYHITQ